MLVSTKTRFQVVPAFLVLVSTKTRFQVVSAFLVLVLILVLDLVLAAAAGFDIDQVPGCPSLLGLGAGFRSVTHLLCPRPVVALLSES